jgi:thymidylate synthase ThyX
MRNELDVVPYILYEASELSLDELQKEVADWSYDKKLEVFNAYIGERLNRRHKPGRAFEHIEYNWDLMCDYGIFRDLQRHRMVEGLQWQKLTPRYGYETPKLIEDANLTEAYDQAFELSQHLFSRLQALGLYEQAQYATLMGHRMRWKISFNAREAFHFMELRTAPQGHPAYRALVKTMHEQLSEIHPLTGGAMKFVNQDEDAALTRLAAERYTQFKLNQLGQ